MMTILTNYYTFTFKYKQGRVCILHDQSFRQAAMIKLKIPIVTNRKRRMYAIMKKPPNSCSNQVQESV